tara:strand:- start:2172 stop:3416 length:1245 start_codon:yes stop_codon:yes gene_type:complete
MGFLLQLVGILIPPALIVGPAVSDILLVLLIIIYLFNCIIKKDFSDFFNFYFYIFLACCIFFIFISFISSNILLSLESSLFYFRFGFFALAISYTIKHYKNFLKYFYFSLFACFIMLFIDATYQLLYNKNFLSLFFEFDEFSYGRIASLFGEEYILGSYVIRLLPLICALTLVTFKKKLKYLLLLIILSISSYLIFISGERTALFMLLLFLTTIFFVFKSTRRTIFIFISIFILSMIISLSINDKLKDRLFNYTIDQVNINFLQNNFLFFTIQHQVVYHTSIKIIKDNYILGIGPKMFREVCKNEKYKTFTEYDRSRDGCQSHPHNTYIQLFTETGVIGFILFCFLYLYVIRELYKKYLKPKIQLNNKEIIEIFCLISFFINFWPLMPSGNFFNNWLSLIYFIPIGFYLYTKKD